jgi:hypothetical protein
MTIDTDEEIRAEFNQGRLPHAGLRIAFRQMKALERVADSLEKLVGRFARPEIPPLQLSKSDPRVVVKTPSVLYEVPSEAPEPVVAQFEEEKLPADVMEKKAFEPAVAAQEEPLSVEDL